jgi:hypothetical protein
VLLAAIVLAPAAALAHRPATKSERAAVLAAVVLQREETRAQAHCLKVTVSTVNSSYAVVAWPKRLSRACRRIEANGVVIEHLRHGSWRFVTAGSSFRCPLRRLPRRVARDLRVCSQHRG